MAGGTSWLIGWGEAKSARVPSDEGKSVGRIYSTEGHDYSAMKYHPSKSLGPCMSQTTGGRLRG